MTEMDDENRAESGGEAEVGPAISDHRRLSREDARLADPMAIAIGREMIDRAIPEFRRLHGDGAHA